MVDASLRATILDELRKLNTEFDISLLYITHDLTTAYQVCDNIVVLYQGSVAEAGSVEKVIREPKHPYTQLLVSSIPVTDRSKRWGEDEVPVPEASAGRATSGCRFAPRCPYAMEECWSTIPPLFQIDNDRAASCFLHKQAPPLPSERIGSVFHRHASHAIAAAAKAETAGAATTAASPPPAPPAPPAVPAP
jgi:peptide/nickel transport system ATP-binding protein